MSVNWGEELDRVEEETKPIEEGEHMFKITGAQPTRAASSGNQMIKMVLVVDGGPDHGKTAYNNLVFPLGNPRAMKMTMKRLGALGFTKEALRVENPTVEQIAARIVGQTVKGVVSHREYKGEIQADVDFIDTPGGSVPAAPRPGVPNVPTVPTPPTAPAPSPAPAAEAPPIPSIPNTDEEPF